MDDASDETLVENSRNGNLGAFKILVLRYEGKVAGVVRSMLGATTEAEDIGQETFIRFYEALPKFRGESSVNTYLTRIAINLSLNEIKRRKRRLSIFLNEDKAINKGIADDKDMSDMIDYEFRQLAPEFRTVATLRLVEGYSSKETADILGVPLGTVLSRLARAQNQLRKAMEKHLK